MGSIYAGLLADAGNEVWVVDKWQDHVNAIRANGLRVEGASGNRVVKLQATTEAADVGEVELLIVATKAMHAEAAATSARPLLTPESTVLTIQNGLGSVEKVAKALELESVVTGVAGGFGASVVEPGHVHHNSMQLIRFGEANGPITPRVQRLTELWNDAGFNVKAFDDIDQLVWEKLICNSTYSGPCTVLEWTIGKVIGDASSWKVASGCAVEAYEVARALSITLSFDDPVQYVKDFGEQMPDAVPSMLLDYRAGRKSEIEVINGSIPRMAAKVDMTVPYNEAITALVLAKESRFSSG